MAASAGAKLFAFKIICFFFTCLFRSSEGQSSSDHYPCVIKADPDPAHQGGRTHPPPPEDAIHALL